MDCNQKIALNIRTIIISKGLIQKRVAEKAGYKEKTFSNMLNGRKLILASDIPKIASTLGVSIDKIYEGESEEWK